MINVQTDIRKMAIVKILILVLFLYKMADNLQQPVTTKRYSMSGNLYFSLIKQLTVTIQIFNSFH